MQDETTPQDSAAMPPALAGSVDHRTSLTDAERTLLVRLACGADHPRAWTNRALTADDRATLRGLLERLK